MLEWSTGEKVEIGKVEVRCKGLTGAEVEVEIPRWRLGLQIMWLGLQILWPFRKRGDLDEQAD